jgi:hypothetical protein
MDSSIASSFTEATFNDKVWKHTHTLELARRDDPPEVFYRQAKAGDLLSAQLAAMCCRSSRPRHRGRRA